MSILDKPTPAEIRQGELAREDTARGLFRQPGERNVGNAERILTGIAGAALVRFGLHRSSLKGKVIFGGLGGYLIQRAVSGYCPVYKGLGTSSAQQHPARARDYFERGIHVETSYVVSVPAETLYTFWRDFSNLPSIMSHLRKVERLTETRSRWTAAGPMGRTVSWDAEIIHDVPDELIAWRSVGDSDVENAGTVRFTGRANGQTEVRVVIDYIPPAGRLGKMVAQLFGEAPEQTIKQDLYRFKTLMETCQAASTNGHAQRV